MYVIPSQATKSITLYVTGPQERSDLNMQLVALDSNGKPLHVNGRNGFTIKQMPGNDQNTDVAITKAGMCSLLKTLDYVYE